MLLGDINLGSMIDCNDMYIGLAYIRPGTVYPTHAHDATELYHALVGTALWGPNERHAKPVEPDNFVFHPSAQPHWFGVPENETFIAIYCWIGHLPGIYWFGEQLAASSQKKYLSMSSHHCCTNPAENVEKFYDDMAEDYEEVVRHWGYNMPETVLTTLVDHAGLTKNVPVNLLDLGCGDGLCGSIIQSRGFTNGIFTGLDISSKMLAKAATRGSSYSCLIKGDFSSKLPFADNFYDYLICAGASSYTGTYSNSFLESCISTL